MSAMIGKAAERDAAVAGRPAERLPVVRVRRTGARHTSDLLAGEEPLEIRLEGEPVAVTMRTPVPGQDAELALGFLLGEAIVRPDQVARVSECHGRAAAGANADVRLWPGERPQGGWQRSFYATSSCGICGKTSIDAVRLAADPVRNGPELDAEVLLGLPDTLRAAQRVFERTGGLHAAALFDATGDLLIAREDVGRHNAVDKVVGRAAMDRLTPLDDHVLMVSGRASFEIVQKAVLAGIPVVAAVSAPSTLATHLARESNMTLIGFLRGDGFNIYAGEARVRAGEAAAGPP
jgi:FdhD protein